MTNPSTINDLRAALKELEEKKRKIDEQYRNVAAALRYFEESKKGPHPPPEESSTSNLGDAIYEILSTERPLHRREVHNRLVEMGMKIPGRDSVNNVGAHLSLDPRFKRVERGVWDLADPPVRDERDERRARFEHIRTNSIGDAIYEILSTERPLHRREVHNRLLEMGMKIPGQSPINNVAAHLSKDPRFKRGGGGVWDLADPPQDDESSQPEQFDFDDESDQQGHVLEDGDDQADEEDEEDGLPW